MIKHSNGCFFPSSDDEAEKLKKIKVGSAVGVDIKMMRNYLFHKKFFAMLDIGFDAFEPAITEYNGVPVQKNSERFRKDIIIAAGFFDYVGALDGTVKASAHSISFGSMSQEKFEKLYNACCNAILARVLHNYTRDDLDQVINQIMRF